MEFPEEWGGSLEKNPFLCKRALVGFNVAGLLYTANHSVLFTNNNLNEHKNICEGSLVVAYVVQVVFVLQDPTAHNPGYSALHFACIPPPFPK